MSTIDQGLHAHPVIASARMIKSREVLWIAIASFLLPVLITEYHILQATNGHICYPVDDTFIHLAIAKNIVLHHVWGISPHGFTSASSSVLYPILLSGCMLLFGVHAIIPLIINILAGIAFVIILQQWLIRQGVTPLMQLVILFAVIAAIPLPVIVMCGMEHTLQILFCFLFVYRFADEMEKSDAGKVKTDDSVQTTWHLGWPVYLYGLLLMSIRYEGAIIVATACLILLIRRKIATALLLGAVSMLPILIFGLYSIAHGNHFVPNSVSLKSAAPPLTYDGLSYFFSHGLFNDLFITEYGGYNLASTQRLLLLLSLVYLAFSQPIRRATRFTYVFLLLIPAVLAQLVFTTWGMFSRYEACLTGCSIVLISVLLALYGRKVLNKMPKQALWLAVLTGILLFIPIVLRIKYAFGLTYQASINIYEQQYQMGQFLGKYYPNTPVAFNDIGAVSWFTQGNNLDMLGLGNVEVADNWARGSDIIPVFKKLVLQDSVKVAIIFDQSFPRALWGNWNKAASWQIPNNVICLHNTVSFFSIYPTDTIALQRNLRDFESVLPKEVVVRYY